MGILKTIINCNNKESKSISNSYNKSADMYKINLLKM